MQNKTLQMKRALRTALLVLLLSVVGMGEGYAYDFSAVCSTGQTLYYNITDASNHFVRMTYPSYNWNGFSPPIGNLVMPQSVVYNGTTYSVTSIGTRAFLGCSALTSITIPNSVTTIGVSAFEGCSALTSITISNSVTSIGVNAFYGCSGLISITIPNSVTIIGTGAFAGCSSLEQIIVATDNPNFDSRNNCNAIIETITNTLISGCKNTIIPNSVTSIGDHAFYGCSGLMSATIPNSITSVGSYVFSYTGWYDAQPEGILYLDDWCLGYKGQKPNGILCFDETIKGIAGSAFDGCYSLSSVTIPNSVLSIGNNVFGQCYSLGLITVAAGNPNYDSRGNCNAIIETSTNTLISGCKNTFIPNSVTSIGDNAFFGCSGLNNITIPNSVTSIGDGAFAGCSNLTSVSTPNSVASIGYDAFWDCSSLTSVTIGNSVTSIGFFAFSDCIRLTTITVFAFTPPTITPTTFHGVPTSISVFVPCRTEESYRTASGWSAFSNIEADCSIHFADQNVKALCVAHWDTDGDGELSYDEAEAVIDIDEVFKDNTSITSFAELEYFTEVVSIGDDAFRGCSRLASVNIPSSVTSIGVSAFYDCSSLTSITIPDAVTAIKDNTFYGCSKLASVNIPNSVSSIGTSAFSGCSTLTSITIPDAITAIKDNTFYGCSKLASVNIPNSVSSFGTSAFYGCSSLTNINIPNSVTAIKDNTFHGCSKLNSVSIPYSVISIEDWAFHGCSALTSINIPNSVSSIGNYVFAGCSGLATVVLPESITSIGLGLFQDCTSLTSIEIPNSVTSIGDVAFYNCSSLTNITIPNSVTTIGGYGEGAFSKCLNLTSIIIPQAVSFLGEWTFSFCSRLTTVYYNAENAYGYGDFTGCPNLTTINIGADVKEIHSGIFESCNTVHFVVALGATPAVLEQGVFSDIANNTILMVSCGNRVTYYSVWNMFDFNNIVENCDEYMVSTNNVGTGGTITASPIQAQMGQMVTLTVRPNTGMRLSSLSVANASDPTQIIPVSPVGKAASTYNFVMPPFNVALEASFTASTGIDESNSIAASVHPNPTKGQVKIEAEDFRHITICNMLGQTVFEGGVSGNTFEYDFSKQKAGIYLIRIETESGVVTKKVSVER